MGRLKGSLNRKPEDRVGALKAWLSNEKLCRALQGGCAWCHHLQRGEPSERAPFRLSFLHKDPATKEFDISQGPNLQGMTQVRLELEVAKCDLICRRCLGQILEARLDHSPRTRKRRSEMSKKERLATQLNKDFDERYAPPGPVHRIIGGSEINA
jgi:hypothetical protein